MRRKNKKTKSLDLTKPVEHPRMPIGVMFRAFLVGSVAVVASSYAIYRHYYVARPSMLEPVPSAAPSYPPDFVPVPEIVEVPPAEADAATPR